MDDLRRNRLRQTLGSEGVGRIASVPDKAQSAAPAVILRGRNSKSNAYIDILTDGNDTDFDIPQKGGLLRADTYPALYDESLDVWNRQRGNYSENVLPLSIRTATQTSSVFDNFNSRGGHFIFNVVAIGANPITPTIWGFDRASGLAYPILVGAAIVAAGVSVLKVYPGIGQVPNVSSSDVIPRNFGVTVAHSGIAPVNYSVSFSQVI